ncbi:interferon regulatory factor 2-like isoform X1 [Alosa sapidissima]|uniref:interferon regulatory factor 2-like isoform X1 n=1 Tax=Alosa sapidissima TaxID=34773 RepID=UPI001C0A042A|nr:interferon regulatory factor 2-like isoform X1 [Alosa sapidissima]
MPVDRMRMRPWLEEQINSGSVKGLMWINKQKKIFQIPWMHAARHGWDLDKDAPLFMNWAIHTGKYHPGVDQPDPKTWKANFRCAMNSLPDIEEVKDKSIKKGNNAFKVYRMLSAAERAVIKEKKKLEKRQNKAKKHNSGDDGSSKGSDEPVAEEEDQVEHEADSTVTIDNVDSAEDQLVISEMSDVCAVVEVTTEHEGVLDSQVSTEREVPPVTSSSVYPRLQVSPISSCGESDAESEYSDEDSKEEWDMRCLSEAQMTCSVLKFPSCKPPSKSTFFNSEKINFKVTSCQEESPMIAYNVRPWWKPHLTTRPMPTRVYPGPRANPRYSSHMRPQTSPFQRPENIPNATSEIDLPLRSHRSTLLPTQTSINICAQTISHMFSQRSPHVPVQTSPRLRPQTSSPVCPQTHPSVAIQTSPQIPSPVVPQAGLHMLYPSSPHIVLQSGSHLLPETSRQRPFHSSLLVSPDVRPSVHPQTSSQIYPHSSPPRLDLQKSSYRRLQIRPDVSPHTSPDVMPHSSTHTGVQIPIIKKSQTFPFTPASTRQSSLPERTCSTDGRASVIVNTVVQSQL